MIMSAAPVRRDPVRSAEYSHSTGAIVTTPPCGGHKALRQDCHRPCQRSLR